MNGLEIAFFCLVVALAVYLPISLLLYVFRERHALSLIRRQKRGVDRLLGYFPIIIMNIRRLLWILLVGLLILPPLLSDYVDIRQSISITMFGLMIANMFVWYHLEKWLYQYITKLERGS